MRRLLGVMMVVLLAVGLLTGCQKQEDPAPSNAIPVLDARFKYRGTLIWLYRNADGQVGMLRGNSRDITGVTKDGAADDGLFTAGKGQWTSISEVKQNLLVYVKMELLDESQKPQVINQPDYVLSVDLEQLQEQMPLIASEDELNTLQAEFQSELLLDKNPLVTITMDSGAEIIMELYPDIAPNTVNNFIYLITHEFYNGTIFHRVAPGFVIQGGDPTGTGRGGPGYSIVGEFNLNGFSNQLLHTRGVLSMARGEPPNTAGSQFFIMVADTPDLDGKYAAFGQVISGMEEVDRIVGLQRDEYERPAEPPVMERVTVETFGATYPPPFAILNE